MSNYHVVHNAPTLPERLKKDAYARLIATASALRLAYLRRLFADHGLSFEEVVCIERKVCTPKLAVALPEDVIAKLTHSVRQRCKTWSSTPPARSNHNLTELVRQVSDYLDVEAQIGTRLQQCANAYARQHVGPPAFEKLEFSSKALLRSSSGPLRLAGPETDHAVDELAADIHERAPWLSKATMTIWHHLRASRATGLSGLALPPLLLYGSQGTGKSTLARILAEQSGTPHTELDVGAGTAAFRIVGVEAGWSTRQIGEVVRLVCESKTANPLIVINEIDKVGHSTKSGTGTRTSMSDALLPLLERSTAARFRCPASGLEFDLSRINWVLTANEVSAIDPVLRSRLEPVEVPSLSHADLDLYIDLTIPEADRELVRQIVSELTTGPQLTLRHISRLADRLRGSELGHFMN